MGGGDSPVYYWGYVMLEKMRMWKGESKTKGRKEAEEKYVPRLSWFYDGMINRSPSETPHNLASLLVHDVLINT